MLKISDSLLKGTLALTVSEHREISPSHRGIYWKSCSKITWPPAVEQRLDVSNAPPYPAALYPWNEEMLVLWLLWWVLSVILRKENKHERFKEEMDYYLIVYAFNWHARHLGFISFQCGMERKYKGLLMVWEQRWTCLLGWGADKRQQVFSNAYDDKIIATEAAHHLYLKWLILRMRHSSAFLKADQTRHSKSPMTLTLITVGQPERMMY